MLIAGDTAKFAMPEITLGIVPGTGGLFRLPRAVGIYKALEMMYLGESIDANEALKLGLVNKVVPAGTAREAACAIASRIADKPSLALATIKRCAREMYSRSRDEIFWMNLEMFEPVFNSRECREGYTAFIEKRQPKFHV
jgi:enoyl-CoA hydratase/carnithine racemase